MMPWQKLRKSNYKNSLNYENQETQNGSAAIELDSQNSGNNTIKIIIDAPSKEGVLDFQNYSQNLANIIIGTIPQFAIGIFGGWGTGKTTLMRMIEGELLSKASDRVLTVWFDAWRYEREKYLAVIPFLRQIRIALENDFAKNRKTSKWNTLRRGLDRTFTAFIESSELSVAIEGSPVSATTNLEKFVNSLKSKGSTWYGDEHVQFHEHATDYLKAALEDFEYHKSGSRIVVFVDDLDRCTPEKAIEVLESVKAFFDIKGIVYVIGMDSKSIDHIIRKKYGENSKIDGMAYLEKIVQLPFQIPVWKPQDIAGSIEKIISKGLEGSELAEEFKEDNRKSLIVKAIEPNPRQVKRFVNNIILAKSVFGRDIDKLIAVQALNFRPEWNRFLELVTKDDTRKTFFNDYYIPLKEKDNIIKNKDALDNFIKEKSDASVALSKETIVNIFQELLEPHNEALRGFLDAGADKILRDIERMEDYRRALEATKLKQEEKSPPMILQTFPSDGAAEVAVNANISATFSEPMSSPTINMNTFTVRNASVLTPIAGAVSLSPDGKTAIFDPTSDLSPDTKYVAEIDIGAKDLAGNTLASAKQWSFTTTSLGESIGRRIIPPPQIVEIASRGGIDEIASRGGIDPSGADIPYRVHDGYILNIDSKLNEKLRWSLRSALEENSEKLRKLEGVKTLIGYYKNTTKDEQQAYEHGILSIIINKILEELLKQVEPYYIGYYSKEH